jgi:hypothetical protein
MSAFAADGSWNVTVVDGSTYTGLHASDGSYNVIKSPGNAYVGATHPCGALYVTTSPGTLVPLRAPDGSLYVQNAGSFINSGQPVTVVSGSLFGILAGPNNVLLLHMDGADGSTTFTDSSPSNHTLTRQGSPAPVISTAQKKFGSASADYTAVSVGDIALDGSADFAFGTGDFTIDMWVYNATMPASGKVLWKSGTFGAGQNMLVVGVAGVIVYYVGTTSSISSSITLNTGQWQHVALVRASGIVTLYVDGSVGGTTADNTNYGSTALYPTFGGDWNEVLFSSIAGYLDEIRVLKGRAAWTAPFTPPTSAYI